MTEPGVASSDTLSDFEKAADLLERGVARNRRVALVVGMLGVAGLSAGVYFGARATASGADQVADSRYNVNMLVFELVRTAGAAALIAAFAWGMLNLARAALDQATRFEKRFVAGHFLVYVLDKFEQEIKDNTIQVADTMSVFKAWNYSVDSAYTNVKFGSKRSQDFSIAVGPKGASVATGKAAPTKFDEPAPD
jgi:hypothetical protein